MRFLKQITWARWKYYDPFETQYYTVFTATIPKPTFQFPTACAMISISNNGGKVFIRFGSLVELRAFTVIPDEYSERMEEGYRQAVTEAEKIQSQLKMIMEVRKLPPGTSLVRTDTGEILRDVEKYLKDAR